MSASSIAKSIASTIENARTSEFARAMSLELKMVSDFESGSHCGLGFV